MIAVSDRERQPKAPPLTKRLRELIQDQSTARPMQWPWPSIEQILAQIDDFESDVSSDECAELEAFASRIFRRRSNTIPKVTNQRVSEYGYVKWFDPSKRYGFITRTGLRERSNGIFFHQSEIIETSSKPLSSGDKVEYFVTTDHRRTNKLRAVCVKRSNHAIREQSNSSQRTQRNMCMDSIATEAQILARIDDRKCLANECERCEGYDFGTTCRDIWTTVSFYRPDGGTEGKSIAWCKDHQWTLIKEGLYSGKWYYSKVLRTINPINSVYLNTNVIDIVSSFLFNRQ